MRSYRYHIISLDNADNEPKILVIFYHDRNFILYIFCGSKHWVLYIYPMRA